MVNITEFTYFKGADELETFTNGVISGISDFVDNQGISIKASTYTKQLYQHLHELSSAKHDSLIGIENKLEKL